MATAPNSLAWICCSNQHMVRVFVVFLLSGGSFFGVFATPTEHLKLSVFIVHEGARTPESVEYVDIFGPANLKPTGNHAYGPTLIPIGANQMARAGAAIRNMTSALLPTVYDPMNFYTLASGEASTLMAANALVQAVYLKSNPAIFSKPASNDILLHGMQHCGFYSETLEHIHASKEWKKKSSEYDALLTKLTTVIRKQEGAEKHPAVRLETLYPVWDYLHSRFVSHGKAGLPTGLTTDDYVELSKALSWVSSREFRVPPGKEEKPAEVLGTLVGGPFLNHLHDLMTSIMTPEKLKNFRPPAVTVYVTQTQSMMSLISALRVPVETIPEFGSVVAVQVFARQGSEQGVARITANGVPIDSTICPGGECSLQEFVDGVNHVKPGGSWGRDCKKSTREVIHNAVIHMPWPWLVLAGVICLIIVVVSVHYTGRGKRHQASRDKHPAYAGLPVDEDGGPVPSCSGGTRVTFAGDDQVVGSWRQGGPRSLTNSDDGDVTPRGRLIHSIN